MWVWVLTMRVSITPRMVGRSAGDSVLVVQGRGRLIQREEDFAGGFDKGGVGGGGGRRLPALRAFYGLRNQRMPGVSASVSSLPG